MSQTRGDTSVAADRTSLTWPQFPLMRTPAPGVAWARGFALLVLVAYAALAVRQLTGGLEYDEAYILAVARNIAGGAGFAGDGVSFSSTSQLFDPNISTGPTLLIPGALLWLASGGVIEVVRLAPLGFFLLYLVAADRLLNPGRSTWVRWAVVSRPLLMTVGVLDLTTSSLVPGRFLGEIPAVACLVAAAALSARRRYLVAGALGGLAILAKLQFALPVAVLFAALALGALASRRDHPARSVLLVPVGALVPVAAFEAYRLLTLGAEGYAVHRAVVQAWLDGQARDTGELLPRIPFRLDGLLDVLSPFALPWALAGVGLGLTVLTSAGWRRTWRFLLRAAVTPRGAAVTGVVLGAASLLGWWLLTSAQDSVRQGIPVLLIGLPLVGLAVASAGVNLHCRGTGARPGWRIVTGTLVAAAFLTVGFQAQRIVLDSSGAELRQSQEATARAIVESGSPWVPRDGFWTNPEYLLLTGQDTEPVDGLSSGLTLWSSTRSLNDSGVLDARSAAPECATTLVSSAHAVLCRTGEAQAPLSPPTAVTAEVLAANPGWLAQSWGAVEGWGAWSAGEQSRMVIPVDTRGIDRLRVTILGQPFGPEGGMATVVVDADGRRVGTWALATSTQIARPTEISFEVPVPSGLPAWTLDIDLATPDAVAPESIGIPAGSGPLGFALTGLRIEPVTTRSDG